MPTGGDTCSPITDKESSSGFVAVQHPGDIDGAGRIDLHLGVYGLPRGEREGRPSVVQVFRH